MKVLHVLYQSYPDVQGSSIRSRDMLRSLSANEQLEVVAVTSPFQAPEQQGALEEKIDGIKYYRTYDSSSKGLAVSQRYQGIKHRLRKVFKIFHFYKKLKEIIKTEKPDLIHTHATFFCFIPTYLATLGFSDIKIIYEVRSLWHRMDQAADKISLSLRLQRGTIGLLEKLSIRLCDQLFVINESLGKELSKEVDKSYTVIPNAVGKANIDKAAIFGDKLNFDWSRRLRFAYVGNLNLYEGVEIAVEVFKRIDSMGLKNIEFHVYGDGPGRDAALGTGELGNSIFFHGRFKPDDIDKIYREIDVVILPRRDTFLTRVVTPLKPLEICLFKKPLMLSNIDGHRELMSGCPSLIYFESDSVESLEEEVLKVVNNQYDFEAMVLENYHFVCTNKTWERNANRLYERYKELIQRHKP